ncbi:MAG: YcgN family cysteine cluster protein [Deltaproteobacteria bacterium]|nr:YcgN family cysteine cluster protein [Deltaproteobacteria bacterium]
MSLLKENFWKNKSLSQLTHEEWEALCDGCGLCCLNKIEDDESGEYLYTNVACSLLDHEKRRCFDYEGRSILKNDCLRLTAENIEEVPWLPSTCAYRLVKEGKDLPWWHPLISGTRQSLNEAGIGYREKLICEKGIDAEILSEYVVDWVTVEPANEKSR